MCVVDFCATIFWNIIFNLYSSTSNNTLWLEFTFHHLFFYSILGRIVRVNDKVILYRQWVRDTYALQNTQRIIINNYLTTSSNNVSVSTNTSSRASTISSGSGSTESVNLFKKKKKVFFSV